MSADSFPVLGNICVDMKESRAKVKILERNKVQYHKKKGEGGKR